jgi:hypothetical protein
MRRASFLALGFVRCVLIGGQQGLSSRMQRDFGWFVDEFKSVIDHS